MVCERNLTALLFVTERGLQLDGGPGTPARSEYATRRRRSGGYLELLYVVLPFLSQVWRGWGNVEISSWRSALAARYGSVEVNSAIMWVPDFTVPK